MSDTTLPKNGQDVIPFNFEGYCVRAIQKDGKALFCAKDVAVALGYSNPVDAIKRHCRLDGVAFRYPIVDQLGRTQEARFITEPDVYRLITGSKLPAAEKFEKWVFEEVLPSIRKHGAYMAPQKIEEALLNPDTIIQLATQLKEEQQHRQALEAQVENDKPKIMFADAVSASHTDILIGDLAKILKGNGVNIGANRLFGILRDKGYLSSRKGTDWNMPTQRSMDLGLFRIKEGTRLHPDGHIVVTKTTKVTGKGQQYFVSRFLNAQLPQYRKLANT